MKYTLQDFEGMKFVKRQGGGATGSPMAKFRYYHGKYYFSMNGTLVAELNPKTDGEGKIDYATANFPDKCIQFVINPINKNIGTYRLKVKNAIKLTNNELVSTFLKSNGIPDDHIDDIFLDHQVTFKSGKMMAIEFSLQEE